MVKATNAPRALYDAVKRKYSGYPNTIVTDAYMRCEVSIQGTVNAVQFNTLINQGSQNNTEVRLNMTDRFCVASMGLFLMKAGTTTTATQAQIGSARLQTYPNRAVFSAANEADNLQQIYNGQLQVKINSVVFYQNWDVMRHYRVPTSQQGVAVSTVATDGIIPVSGYDSVAYPFSSVVPSFELDGKGKNEINLVLPNSTNLGGTNSQNFVVLILRGLLIQNGSERPWTAQ